MFCYITYVERDKAQFLHFLEQYIARVPQVIYLKSSSTHIAEYFKMFLTYCRFSYCTNLYLLIYDAVVRLTYYPFDIPIRAILSSVRGVLKRGTIDCLFFIFFIKVLATHLCTFYHSPAKHATFKLISRFLKCFGFPIASPVIDIPYLLNP